MKNSKITAPEEGQQQQTQAQTRRTRRPRSSRPPPLRRLCLYEMIFAGQESSQLLQITTSARCLVDELEEEFKTDGPTNHFMPDILIKGEVKVNMVHNFIAFVDGHLRQRYHHQAKATEDYQERLLAIGKLEGIGVEIFRLGEQMHQLRNKMQLYASVNAPSIELTEYVETLGKMEGTLRVGWDLLANLHSWLYHRVNGATDFEEMEWEPTNNSSTEPDVRKVHWEDLE